MPSLVHQREQDDVLSIESDEIGCGLASVFKVSFPDGTEEVGSPDEACDLISDLVAEQFWDWFNDPARPRRFKPRFKVYEVR